MAAAALSEASTSTSAPPTDNHELFPPLTTSAVLACQFSSWYPLFKRHSPKAVVIRPIPHEEEFLEWLESDGLFMPEGSGPMGVSEMSDSEDEEEEQDSDSDDDGEGGPVKQFSFPHLDSEIRAVLRRYDGAVFPKLNWSSPQDAAWMIPGQNLKCQHPADVYLLLKSSDFISHDLDHAFDDCVDYTPSSSSSSAPPPSTSTPASTFDGDDLARLDLSADSNPETATPTQRKRPYQFELVLKKWFDMPKSQEWRCFVREGVFLGISQRDTTFYDFLQPAQVQQDLREQLIEFWEEEVQEKMPLSSYAFDVYLTRDGSRVFIVDCNPYTPSTDPLLFDYSDLLSLFRSSTISSPDSDSPDDTPDLPVLRLVNNEVQAARSMPRYSHNRYPKELVELSEGQSIAEFAKEWMGKVADAAVDVPATAGASGSREESDKVEERLGR